MRVFIGLCLIGSTFSALADAQSDAIERGAYLAAAGDCSGCHTREGGGDYSGGLPIDSPLGTMYSKNITSDEETGIGLWTEEDFRRLLRLGRGDEGEYIYPAMPYTAYTKMTDSDISDLWAYIQNLEPVNYSPPENEMMFPANIREGMAVWQAVELETGAFEPDPEQDDVYNRGAYLVEALGHCSACHSPRNLILGEKEDERYTGAEIHGWYAPNISSGPMSVIADRTVEELSNFLRTGVDDENQKVVGEMAAVVHESLSQLRPDDVTAMATYLKNRPTDADEVEQSMDDDDEGYDKVRLNAGRALFATNCMGCHQSDGKGIEAGAPSLANNTALSDGPSNNVIMMMLEGHAPEEDSTWGVMPSFAEILSASDIADVANYVRTSWGNTGTTDATTELVTELRQVAELPEGGQQAAIDCPVLSGILMEPTLEITDEEFESALNSSNGAKELVAIYRAGEGPESPEGDIEVADTVQALASAYCRTLAEQGEMSNAEQQARVAALAGRVSVAVSQ